MMCVDLCCLLWARPGRRAELHAYEDKVLALVADHGGTVRQRAIGSDPDQPDEVQIITIDDRAALDRFMGDPRRAELSAERDDAIARTELFEVDLRGIASASEEGA